MIFIENYEQTMNFMDLSLLTTVFLSVLKCVCLISFGMMCVIVSNRGDEVVRKIVLVSSNRGARVNVGEVGPDDFCANENNIGHLTSFSGAISCLMAARMRHRTLLSVATKIRCLVSIRDLVCKSGI